MARATLRTVVIDKSADGVPKIDHLTKDSGILRTAIAKPSSNGLWHKFKKREALPAYSIVAPGGAYSRTSLNSDVLQLALVNIGSMQSEPADIVDEYDGGARQYFKDEEPSYLEGYGQKASQIIIYGNNSTFGDVNAPLGLHQIAKANTVSQQAGGASGSTTSIFAVRWSRQNCSLLYNKNQVMNGKFVNIEVLNNGMKVLAKTNGADTLTPEYQVLYNVYLSLYSSSVYDINAITQIDATHKPTVAYMNQLLDDVKASSTDTVLYVNRRARRYLMDLKNTQLVTNVTDKDYDVLVDKWNGITLILDENISDVETNVLD